MLAVDLTSILTGRDAEGISGPVMSHARMLQLEMSGGLKPPSIRAQRTINSANVPRFILNRMSESDSCQNCSMLYGSTFPFDFIFSSPLYNFGYN